MIKKIPGWLNFILLLMFYNFMAYGLLKFVLWMTKNYYRLFAQFKQLGLFVASLAIVIILIFYAGGYLAKWREKQGGGWSFNGFGEWLKGLFKKN